MENLTNQHRILKNITNATSILDNLFEGKDKLQDNSNDFWVPLIVACFCGFIFMLLFSAVVFYIMRRRRIAIGGDKFYPTTNNHDAFMRIYNSKNPHIYGGIYEE